MPTHFTHLLKNRIDLQRIPFSDRGSRLMVMLRDESLTIRLTERWHKADPRLSAYRERPPIIEQLSFTGPDGRVLPFDLESYPHRLDFHTSLGVFTMVFADTESLLVRLPEQACGVSFIAHVDQAQIDRRGGILRVTGDIRRNIAYTTNRTILRNSITPTPEGNLQIHLRLSAGAEAGLLLNLTPRLGFNRYIPGIEETISTARQHWEDWFSLVPPVAPQFRRQYLYAWWIMRAGLISTRFYTTREAMTPSKIHYVGVWQWDAYFHALAYRYIDPHLARDQIRVVLDHQRNDGMIPDAVHDEGTITHLNFPVDADVTKPPLVAWTAWKLFETDGDREFLDEIYEPVVRWNRWWFEKNDVDGDGLCEYLHPFSSGLDDSPLWDGGMPVTSPDLNTYLYLQQENLARIADVIGLSGEAEQWREQNRLLLDRILLKLWDEEAGVFWPLRAGEPVRILTPFSLFPLLIGTLPSEIAERLVGHLTDPETFWTDYPVPTVAVNDPYYNPSQMWRGPTWVNANFLLIEGLNRSGYPEVAQELRRRTLRMLDRQADIFEYYDCRTGEPCGTAAPVFGWSAALFIELALMESGIRQ